MLLTALRLLLVAIGCWAYYAAFFMYEDEEGKWQDRIEKLWVAIDDRKNSTGRRTSLLFNKIAIAVTRGFNRVFGRRLLSIQSVGVSTCYSFAGMFLLVTLLLMIVVQPSNLTSPLSEDVSKSLSYVQHLCLIVGLVFLLLGALPSLLPSRWFAILSFLPFLFLMSAAIYLIRNHRASQRSIAFFAALLLSLLSDIFLLILVRFTLRWVSATISTFRIATAVLIQVSVIVILVIAPFEIATASMVDLRQPGWIFQMLAMMADLNAFTGLASSLFLLALFFVLLHKVFWPVLSKLFYPLARHKMIRNRRIMASVGTGCFVLAFGSMTTPIRNLLDSLAK
jgi:hypothetical protein